MATASEPATEVVGCSGIDSLGTSEAHGAGTGGKASAADVAVRT